MSTEKQDNGEHFPSEETGMSRRKFLKLLAAAPIAAALAGGCVPKDGSLDRESNDLPTFARARLSHPGGLKVVINIKGRADGSPQLVRVDWRRLVNQGNIVETITPKNGVYRLQTQPVEIKISSDGDIYYRYKDEEMTGRLDNLAKE